MDIQQSIASPRAFAAASDRWRTPVSCAWEALKGEAASPFNRVITFMSLLELLKQHSVKAEQKKRYGDITVTRIEAGEAND